MPPRHFPPCNTIARSPNDTHADPTFSVGTSPIVGLSIQLIPFSSSNAYTFTFSGSLVELVKLSYEPRAAAAEEEKNDEKKDDDADKTFSSEPEELTPPTCTIKP
jgi:hypothetical protein